ncbi:MAG: glycosyltransferase [Phycisphaerales bacterium]
MLKTSGHEGPIAYASFLLIRRRFSPAVPHPPDTTPVLNTLWLVDPAYATQYDLINDFIGQLAAATTRAGLPVNLSPREVPGLRPAALYFNYSPDFPGQARTAAQGGDRCAVPPVLHWLIDHPLSLRSDVWSQAEKTPGYRLLTVSDDDAQLIALRHPGIRQARCWHGVAPEALCDASTLAASHAHNGARDIDVLITGTILTEAQIAERRDILPAGLRKTADDIVALRLEHPWMAFTQAFDLCAPAGLHSSTHWDLLHAVFVHTTAAVNTARRLALVRALNGLNVTVIGKGPWETRVSRICACCRACRTENYPRGSRRTRVSLAVNPTQFVHAFSERLLLSFAGGAASVTDDRLWVRREFSACTERFNAAEPAQCRQMIEHLLANRPHAAAIGAAGREIVASRHLWQHRLNTIAIVATHAGSELGWAVDRPVAVPV